tara:strand:+ start:165 stop:710 length:546 start_codon:yes stop_codon:yes gene_type:complete
MITEEEQDQIVKEIALELINPKAQENLVAFVKRTPEALEAYRIIRDELPTIGLNEKQHEFFMLVSSLFMQAGASAALERLEPSIELAVKRALVSRKQRDSGQQNENKHKKYLLNIAEKTWQKYPEATPSSLAKKLIHQLAKELKADVPTQKAINNWLTGRESEGFRPKVRSVRSLEYSLVI